MAEATLNCYHLTEQQVRHGVIDHIVEARQICSGSMWNKRHEMFYNAHASEHMLEEIGQILSMETTTCIYAFEDDKIRLILNMLRAEFGNQAMYNFLVLLPELCLRIFMDVHNMTYDEVVHYIENRPRVSARWSV